MIKRIERILENAHFGRYKSEVEIDITQPSYENAMMVEELKEETITTATRHMIDELVRIKQNYPSSYKSVVEAEVDIVVLEGRQFRELQKLINGLHEIWLQKEREGSQEKSLKKASV